MRYNRNLTLPDAAWVQFRIMSMLLSNFVYRRRWYARKSRGHYNPHNVSDDFHQRVGNVADRVSKFYAYLCRTDPYDTSHSRIGEEERYLRGALDSLKENTHANDFLKFKSTWKKIDDELKILEGHAPELEGE